MKVGRRQDEAVSVSVAVDDAVEWKCRWEQHVHRTLRCGTETVLLNAIFAGKSVNASDKIVRG